MQPYQVLTVPHPFLRKEAKAVSEVDQYIREAFDRMIVTMEHEDGIGLSGNQVGLDMRLVVMDIHDHEDGACGSCQVYKMANPEIIWHSDEKIASTEGCLSVPGQYAEVTRFQKVKVKYLDEDNKEQTLEAEGLLSDCIQHEIDHLNGILFVDHLTGMKKKMLIQKAKKVAALRIKEEKNP